MTPRLCWILIFGVTTVFVGCNQKGSAMKKRNIEALSKSQSEISGSTDSSKEFENCARFVSPTGSGTVNLEGKTIAIYDDYGKQEIHGCVDYSERDGDCRFKDRFDSTWSHASCTNEFGPTYFGIYCLGTPGSKYINPACNNQFWKEGCRIIGNQFVKNRSMKFDGTSFSYTDDGKTHIQAKIVPKGSCEPVNPWPD